MKPWRKKVLLASAALAVVAFLVYVPAISNGFVNWDDQAYIYDNLFIRTLDIRWLLTSEVNGIWHPLTMLSLVADYALWGLDARGYHLVNVVLHAINTALAAVFAFHFFRVVAKRKKKAADDLRGALFAAAVTALFFGLHPLRVESVAWVSERKDVLCGLFFLLSLIFYFRYAAPPRNGWAMYYAASLVCFILALASKPMAVTLPVVLLILDAYPLGRFAPGAKVRRVLAEKAPFFALSAVASAAALWAQRHGGALAPLEPFPLSGRVMVAARAVVFYLYKTIVPVGLAPFYPRQASPDFLGIEYAGAFAAIILITALCIIALRKRQIFATAWAYYLVTLAPVAGVIQVGSQAAADRYTYLPSLGPALVVGALAGWLFMKKGAARRFLPIAVVVVSAALSLLTIRQVHYWHDSVSLWTREVAVYPNSALGYTNLGLAYKDERDFKTAIRYYDAAIGKDRYYADAYGNRGVAYSALGDYARAVDDFTAAIRLRPANREALSNRAVAYMALGRYPEAIDDLSTAIAFEPENPLYARLYYNRGIAYKGTGDYERAITDFTTAIRLEPYNAGAYNNRGGVYLRTRRFALAEKDFQTAVRLEPGGPLAYFNLGIVYMNLGDRPKAVESLKKAASLGLAQAREYLIQLGETTEGPGGR